MLVTKVITPPVKTRNPNGVASAMPDFRRSYSKPRAQLYINVSDFSAVRATRAAFEGGESSPYRRGSKIPLKFNTPPDKRSRDFVVRLWWHFSADTFSARRRSH
ncbi:hypothetical protein EVAR_3239_1 [Eumeta japonica]|uniref:Uncharacterized protein n=1 Tax=Eumeta variegata TaxID=151549 RepID=A0A4C1SUX9_EUMVA|nr:hypothetical protein EVAR_3239_1 [Eumeta japonica]